MFSPGLMDSGEIHKLHQAIWIRFLKIDVLFDTIISQQTYVCYNYLVPNILSCEDLKYSLFEPRYSLSCMN